MRGKSQHEAFGLHYLHNAWTKVNVVGGLTAVEAETKCQEYSTEQWIGFILKCMFVRTVTPNRMAYPELQMGRYPCVVASDKCGHESSLMWYSRRYQLSETTLKTQENNQFVHLLLECHCFDFCFSYLRKIRPGGPRVHNRDFGMSTCNANLAPRKQSKPPKQVTEAVIRNALHLSATRSGIRILSVDTESKSASDVSRKTAAYKVSEVEVQAQDEWEKV